MDKTINVLVVNLNNIKYTKNCIDDLLNQDYENFKITLVDQASSEFGTDDFLNSITDSRITIIRNEVNTPLNHVWNWFSEYANEDLLCFLNNDVRLSINFISDTLKTFLSNDTIGIAVHTTNHPTYDKKLPVLRYEIMKENKYMQGWDYTIKKELFKKIPETLRTYCGDDFIFQNVYNNGFKLAYILSSPMIHYEGKSKKYLTENGVLDIHRYIEMGYPHHLKPNTTFTNIRPTFNFILDNEC
jgi:GT2 family glycosyltransferase